MTNGNSTVPELRATGLAHHILCWRDALHDGPVPDVPDDELRRIRARFLAGENAADLGTAEEFTERGALEAHRDGDYVLWFEADLYDQLQLIQIVAKLAELQVPPSRITLICIGEYPTFKDEPEKNCDGATPVFRTYHSFSQVADENGLSRIWIGWHFRNAVEAGHKHGAKIGNRALNRFFQPVN